MIPWALLSIPHGTASTSRQSPIRERTGTVATNAPDYRWEPIIGHARSPGAEHSPEGGRGIPGVAVGTPKELSDCLVPPPLLCPDVRVSRDK